MLRRTDLGIAFLVTACSAGAPAPQAAPSKAPPAKAPADSEAWRQVAPKPDPSRPFAYPVAQKATLENGLTVLFLERDTPLLTVSVVLKRGSSNDPPGKKGLMALTGRMLVEETLEKNSLALAEAAESLGGELAAHTDYDSTSIDLEFLRADMEKGFALLAEVVGRPRFAPKVFERVRDEWLDQLRAQRQEPSAVAAIAGARAVLGPDLGAPADGAISDVAALTSADLRSSHQTLYDPSGAALVVVGGIGFDDVMHQARRAFSKWKPARPATEAAARDQAPTQARKLLVNRPGAVQTAIFVGLRFPRRSEEGFERRELLNQVLGGMFTSRLNQNLRERNAFTYGAYSHDYAAKHFGIWELNTSVKSEDTGPALREILAELEAIRGPKPVTEEELERAKRELLGSYTAHLERSATVNGDISGLFVDELDPDYLSRLGETVHGIGVEQVQREATLRIRPDQVTIVLVGDQAKMGADPKSVSGDALPAPASLVD